MCRRITVFDSGNKRIGMDTGVLVKCKERRAPNKG